ncbi:hypothetical protein FQN55_008103 [Onygenales sp. PD_40]|nr:hypothetical protein FQN55_008103 [Onygenales sp. PD_40]
MAATTVVTAMPASSNNPANDIVQRSPGVDECIGWGAPCKTDADCCLDMVCKKKLHPFTECRQKPLDD